MSLDTIQLETSGKGEKLASTDAVRRLKDIEDVKVYLAKLTQSPGKKQNPLLQKQVTDFLEQAANNGLPKQMDKYNARKFDTDGEAGLDSFEFEKFTDSLKGAITQIVALDSIGAFSRVHGESQEGGSWSNPDKWMAEKVDVSKMLLGEKGSSSFTEDAIKKMGNISPEELHKMEEKPFSLSAEGGKDMAILLSKELGSGVEDMLRFLGNIPAGIVLLPRYAAYRMDTNSSDIEKKTEGDIKLAGLVEANPSLAIIELLGEKGIQMIKELASKMKSGKQGDIAMVLVTIAGLVAGGAGALKLTSSLARKSAVRAAREAGSAGRKAGEVISRESRNTLKSISQTAGKVAETANKVDSIVSGNAALGKVASVVSSGVKKVAPMMGASANDASHINDIERARAKKEQEQLAHAVAGQEMKATGTDGPTRGPRMSTGSPFDGVSTESLQNQYELSRIITGQDARLTQREGDLMREIQRRENPGTPGTSETPKLADKKNTPPTTESAPSTVVDFADKKARELGRFRDEVLMSGSKPPLLYIERDGAIEIGRMVRMVDGKAIVEFVKDGKISQKPYSLEDLAKLNDPEKRIHPSITREIQEKRRKMEQAYEKSGISPLEIQKNSGLSYEDRIKKAEAIMGRAPDQWEALAIDHIHNNISKGIYKNSIGDLKKMAQMWEQMTGNSMKDKAKFAEFRKLVENGILGADGDHVAAREATRIALDQINRNGLDSFIDRIPDRKLNQSQLNAIVLECFDAHGSSIAKMEDFLTNIMDVAGYTGDKTHMYNEAMQFARDMKLEKLIINIDSIPLTEVVKQLSSDVANSPKILKAFMENGKSSTKLEFFQLLENNDTLRNSIVTGPHADLFIRAISAYPKDLGKLIGSIINDESTLKKIAPENLKSLEVFLDKMIKDGTIGGGLAETLRSKLALARDNKKPLNRIRNFLQNGDDETFAKLGEDFSSEKAAWNLLFDDLRIKDGGVQERMRMIERGERSFFYKTSMDAFTFLTFPELPFTAQKDFIKKFVAPKDAKYHGLIEEFPHFADYIREHGWI